MPKSWSTREGLDLLVGLDRSDLRSSLERGLRAAICSGRLTAGTRMPSSRSLSCDLGVARGTVAAAYRQLGAEGFLSAVQGSGTTVASQQAPRVEEPDIAPEHSPRLPWDLRPGRPDLSGFPRAAWLSSTRRVLAGTPSDAFGYGDHRGRPELRTALATYLGRARGVVVPPSRIVVCAGFSHALALLATVMRASGHRSIGFENPSIPEHRAIAAAAGLEIEPVSVDDGGARFDETRSRAVVVTPAHQYPLGATLHADRRIALAAWARRPGRFVLEDDYDGEFRYDRQPVGALQGLASDAVVYAGTASKTLAPGLRMGWLALPALLVAQVLDCQGPVQHHPSVLDQLVLADLIASGGYDKHIRQCRIRYRQRRDLLLTAVRQAAPAIRVTGVAAGLQLVLQLGDESPSARAIEQHVIDEAAGHGLALQGLSECWHDNDTATDTATEPVRHPPGLVVGYATPSESAFRPTVKALADVLAMVGPRWPAGVADAAPRGRVCRAEGSRMAR